MPSLKEANYTTFLKDNFGAYAPQVEKLYPLSAFSASPVPVASAMNEIITDSSYFCPAHRALNAAVQNSVPVWTYLYNHTSTCAWFEFIPSEFLAFLGPTHTEEIPFVFGNLDHLPLPNGNCTFSKAEHDISSTLIAAWTAMAENGNPSVEGGLQWPAYNSSSMGLNIEDGVTAGKVDYSKCAFWQTVDTTILNFTATATNGTSASTTSSMSSSSPTKNSAGHSLGFSGSTLGLAILAVYVGLTGLL